MLVGFNLSGLKDSKWHEYLVRFVLGGAATVCTGLLSKAFGPSIGGLFLAMPVIFCASASLIEKHARDEKTKHGLKGERRGQEAAALDAAGAALGSIGMLAFAAAFYGLVATHTSAAFFVAFAAWAAVAVAAWWIWLRLRVTRNLPKKQIL
jgi:hypothetical protein